MRIAQSAQAQLVISIPDCRPVTYFKAGGGTMMCPQLLQVRLASLS